MKKMPTRSSSNKKVVAKPQYTGLTYGTTGPTNDLIPKEDKRKYNLPPVSNANTQDNTRNAEVATETAPVVAQTVQQSGPGMMQANGMNLDILRDMDNAESATFGAAPVSIPPAVIGDMDYEVLADLSENTETQALIEILGL